MSLDRSSYSGLQLGLEDATADIVVRDLLKQDSKDDASVDLSLIKHVSGLRQPELWIRMPSLALATIGLAMVYGDMVPLALMALYSVTLLSYRYLLSIQRERVSSRRFLGLMGLDSISIAMFVALALYFWTSDNPAYSYISIFLVTGFFLYSLGERSRVLFLFRVDAVAQFVMIAGQIVWIALNWENPKEALVVSVGLLMIYGYFMLNCRKVRWTRWQLAEAQKQRVADERLMAVGRLSGGIAHDFNNMLTAVLGNIELMRLTHNPVERAALMNDAEKAARSGAEMISRLLAYSRKAQLRPREMSFADLIEDSMPVARGFLMPGQDLRLRCDLWPMPSVLIDPQQFRTVVGCLIDNAAQSMAGGAIIHVTCGRTAYRSDADIVLTIEDTGTGIQADVLPFVFEPYFTTKPKGQGSGLGLAMARGIVEQSGGKIAITSEPGVGTKVMLYLPILSLVTE